MGARHGRWIASSLTLHAMTALVQHEFIML